MSQEKKTSIEVPTRGGKKMHALMMTIPFDEFELLAASAAENNLQIDEFLRMLFMDWIGKQTDPKQEQATNKEGGQHVTENSGR